MKKKIFLVLMGIVCSMCLSFTPAATITSEAATKPGIETQQHIKTWIYREDEENGILWKRLWNCSTYEWEGDWIFVRYL